MNNDYAREQILVILPVIISILFLPVVVAFSGTESGYVVQGSLGWIGSQETNSSYTVTFSGLDQPVGRANGTNITGCLGFICPTRPYARFVGISPTAPRTLHVLDCGFNVTDTDIEESLIGNVTWYVDNGSGFIPWTLDDQNNIPIPWDNLTNTSATGDVESEDTAKNQQWKCSLLIADGFFVSRFNSSPISILNTPPVVHAIKTFLGSLETSDFEPGDTVITRVNVTDDDGRIDIDQVLVTYTDPLLSPILTNATMTNTTEIPSGYLYEYPYVLSGFALTGEWIITVFANDTDRGTDANTTTFIVFSPEATVQFILTINDTSSTVFIPGVGSINASDISPTEYVDPPHYYLTSEMNNLLRALVFQQQQPLSLIINKTPVSHVLEINQEARNSKTYLVFTSGDTQKISNRIDLVETGEFLTKITPTFGFGLGDKFPVKILLQYPDIDVGGNVSVLQRGEYGLVFESNKSESRKSLFVNQVSP